MFWMVRCGVVTILVLVLMLRPPCLGAVYLIFWGTTVWDVEVFEGGRMYIEQSNPFEADFIQPGLVLSIRGMLGASLLI